MIQRFDAGFRVERSDDSVDIRFSTVLDGDMHGDLDPATVRHRRAAFAPGVWTQPQQVHGTTVVVVESPGQHDGATADAVVTSLPGVVLGIWVADCAPVAIVGRGVAIAGVHAGWRGALAGVIGAALEHVPDADVAVLGPCLRACCNEFGAADLAAFADRFGSDVIGSTSWGTPALDLPAVVRAACSERGVSLVDDGRCTGCSAGTFFSHRMRGERGRQMMTVCKRVRG